MNFVVRKSIGARARRRFIVLSICGIFIVTLSAVYFSNSIVQPNFISSPETYYASIIGFFKNSNSPIVVPIFLVAVFCMIFTTIDTLLLTSLQISSFFQIKSNQGDIRSRLSTILVICVIFSAIVPANMVCAGGIFVGSLLIIPVSAFLQKIFPTLNRVIPKNWFYIPVSIIVSTLIFGSYYQILESGFEFQFIIPGIVVTVTFITAFLIRLYELWKEKYVTS